MPAPFGQFRNLMSIEQRTIEVNPASQEQVETWTAWKTAYCLLTPQSSSESQRGGQSGPVNSDATHLIECWFINDLKPDMRFVKADGRIFEIVSIIDEQERNETMNITARERAD